MTGVHLGEGITGAYLWERVTGEGGNWERGNWNEFNWGDGAYSCGVSGIGGCL